MIWTSHKDLLDFGFVDQKGEAIVILTDGHGFTLVLSDVVRFGGEAPPRYPEGFHVGVILDGPDAVDSLHGRLAAAGIALGHRPRTVHGNYGFYFTALETILFEVSCPRE